VSRLLRQSSLVAAALALAAGACDGRLLLPSAVTNQDLAAARAAWTAQHITDYEFTLQRMCFCAETRPMRVTVRAGKVTFVRPVGELLPLPGAEAELYPSIVGIFDLIESALAWPAAGVWADYDAVRGFPHEVRIDYYANVADDELTLLVSDIRAQ
jgi:hypothetical protein